MVESDLAPLSTELFDFELPEELIAQFPMAQRDESRMLVVKCSTGECIVKQFRDIVNYLNPGDAMIFNDTRVLRARFHARKNGDPAGAKLELLLIAPVAEGEGRRWRAFLKPGKRAGIGVRGVFMTADGSLNENGDYFEVIDNLEDGEKLIEFSSSEVEKMQNLYGHIPLPPYIKRGDENADAERYQTIFAHTPGAVAAPTAGLHFSPEIREQLHLKNISEAAVTLHVGPGTFKPVSVADVTNHQMHSESFIISEATAKLINNTRSSGHKVLAVGTTSVRTIESCADVDGTVHASQGETRLFMYPPYKPRAVDMLLTNFHLPKSTLIMLVSCFASREKILAAYEIAKKEKMRFYSYGDCMLLIP